MYKFSRTLNKFIVLGWSCVSLAKNRYVQINEMHALYDKHHKVSSFVKSHQNTHNYVKYEVI